jgi:PAB1-binding protein PBP1
VNPKKISTSNVDCPAMIKNNRLEREKNLRKSLEEKKLSHDKIQCIMDKFQIDRAFDSNLALEVIEHLDISLEDKRRNRENIAKKLEAFIKSIFVCSGFQVGSKLPNINPISIMSL